ncbi:MAG: hypothetical protein AAB614_01775 [Patescibacteria group bacterium]
MFFKLFKISIYGFAISFLILPSIVSAHVKWFVDKNNIIGYVNQEPTGIYITAWLIITTIIILVGILLEKYLPKKSKQTEYKINSLGHKIASIFSIIIGLFLLIASYKGFLFSDNLSDLGFLKSILIAIQALIGFGFLIGFGVRLLSILLIILWTFIFLYLGPINTLEAIWVFGVAIFSLIYGRAHFKMAKSSDFSNRFFLLHEKYAIPILRLMIGIDLLILGFTEKLLEPELGLAFLNIYNWNFMQNIGLDWYSDYLFVLSAGFVESILGLVFILGIVTRLNAVIALVIFGIPIFFMGPLELFGHLPHLVIVVMLFIFGSGEKLKLIQNHKIKIA